MWAQHAPPVKLRHGRYPCSAGPTGVYNGRVGDTASCNVGSPLSERWDAYVGFRLRLRIRRVTWVDIHAITLLTLPVATGILLCCVPRRRPNSRQATIATAFAAGAIILVLALNTHLCRAGNPAMQCLLGGVCIWGVLSFAANRWLRGTASLAIITIMFVLSSHYDSLVHGREWLGNVTNLAAAHEKLMDARLQRIRSKLHQISEGDAVVYSEGWVRDLPISSQLSEPLSGELPSRIETRKVWHSSFTRLLSVRWVRQDYWYPGGQISKAIEGIELRDMP